MRRLATIIALAATAFPLVAANVTTTAGSLSASLDDNTVTELTVTGTLDARDFVFIGSELSALEALDLSEAVIVAYHADRPLVGAVCDFAADEVPPLALMGHAALRRVVLPSSLTGIGEAAFAGCPALADVALPDMLTAIGPYAFSATALPSVTVPATVTSFGEGAFARCPLLTAATIASTEVADHAFMACPSLADVTLAEGVQRIGVGAFTGCAALTEVTLPASVTTVADEAFAGSGVVRFDASASTATALGDWSLASTPLQTVSLPDGMSALGEGALFGTSSLAGFGLPADVAELPAYSMAGSALAKGTLPDDLTEIGNYALYRAAVPTAVTLPSGITTLGNYAMAYVSGMDTLRVLATDVPALGEQVWYGVNQPAVKLDVADNTMADLYAEAAQWQDFHILRTYLMGDVNIDAMVDITDVSMTIGYVVGGQVNGFHYEVADMNGDGFIDVGDISEMVNCILTDRTVIVRKARRMGGGSAATADCVGVSDLAISAGRTATLEVTLSNERTDYTAFECTIRLPQGLRLVEETATVADRTSAHVAAVRGYDSSVRLMMCSMSVAPISGTEGVVARFDVVADDNLDLSGVISVDDVVFATTGYERVEGIGSQSYLTDVTGVGDLIAASSARVYGAEGIIVVESTEASDAGVVTVGGASRRVVLTPGRNEIPAAPGIYVVNIGGKGHKVVVR